MNKFKIGDVVRILEEHDEFEDIGAIGRIVYIKDTPDTNEWKYGVVFDGWEEIEDYKCILHTLYFDGENQTPVENGYWYSSAKMELAFKKRGNFRYV